jgi:phosphoglycerate kinase
MNYKTLKDLPDVPGIPIIARLDLNAPVASNNVVDDYRIRKSLPTIQFLQKKAAKVIILSHIEGGTDTLRPVFERLKRDIPAIKFCEDCIENGSDMVATMKAGEVLLCENIRLYDGEKKNDEAFAKKLASLGHYYVNDGFSVSHRKHASIVGIPKFLPGFLGLQFEQEIEHLSKLFNPPHPFVFILGGAKFDTKLPLIQKFLTIADTIVVAGALANDIYKTRGWNVGDSLVADADIDLSALSTNPKIVVPQDVLIKVQGKDMIVAADNVPAGANILDAGPESMKNFSQILTGAKAVLWNGPLGNYENGYKQPTLELAKLIAETGGLTVLGGGDTLAAIQELGIEDMFTFVSTGGGAMLDFLAEGTLPGLEALKDSK